MTTGNEGATDLDYLLRRMAEGIEQAPVNFPITLVINGNAWEGNLITEGEFMRIQAATLDALSGDEKSEEVAGAQASIFRQIGIMKYENALDDEERVSSFIHLTDAWQRGVPGVMPVMRVRISSVDAWSFGHSAG
ncbi:hypothetical protein [Dietzia sp. B32]|uniref:hypothetical protein n=1 Tax=Dietzia sp. B32 TaxID=2915130 RepID=UPI0021AE0FCC|nr:hypothetical protein [Dietzia sp. B32]UVE95179.1 hypothetical protein L8M95_17070 [Dietzia sp. B32]